MTDPVFRPLNTGDTQDDDPQVIDSLVEAVSAPPTPVVEPIVTPPLPEPKVPTRLLSVRQRVDPTWSAPTLLLPEDTRREYLYVSVTSAAETAVTTDGVIFRSETGPAVGGLLMHGNSLPLDHHTGALLVSAIGTDPVYVDVWSVTK